MSEPTVPSTAVPVNPAAWPRNGLRFSAEHKGARHGCKDGVLTLRPAGLAFLCLTDQNKSFSVDSSQIKGIDDDGVESLSNEKFHFKISGKSKEEVRQLFANWMDKATVASAEGSNAR
jgi:hypothetical protein